MSDQTTTSPADRLQRWLAYHDECGDASLYAGLTPEQAWAQATPEHLIWAATRRGVLDDRTLRRFASWCVRQVWHLLTDERSRRAVEVAERHAAGLATDEELAAAAYAADAAYADAYAARAAAYAADAADAAYAAYAAAYAAYAARAAADAAYAADAADAADAAYAAADAAAAAAYADARAARADAADARAARAEVWACLAAWLRAHARPDWSVIDRDLGK